MRIGIVSDLVRPNGAGVMTLLAADMLTSAGHDVAVLAGSMHADLARELHEQHQMAAAFTHDEKALDGSVTPTDHLAFVRAFQQWLARGVEGFDADLLYVHNCGRVLSQLDLADWSRRLPVIHTMHDEWFITDAHYTFDPGEQKPVMRTYEPGSGLTVLEHRYDHLFEVPARSGNLTLVGPSQWLTNRAAAVFPELSTVHLANAVDTSTFELQDRDEARAILGLPAGRSIVLFVGNPTDQRKAFAALEGALRHVVGPDGKPPLRLVAGGDGSLAIGQAKAALAPGPILTRLAADSPPKGDVRIEGDGVLLRGLDRSLMPAMYGAADVLVHPSRIDNLPTVPIEAGLCGTRCLASDVGGTAETIADTSDLFPVDIGSKALAARITDALATTPGETTEIRQGRRDRQLERFSIELHQAKLLSLLDQVASGGRP